MRRSHVILLAMLALALLSAVAVGAVRMFGPSSSSANRPVEGRVFTIAVATEETIGRREEISTSTTQAAPGAQPANSDMSVQDRLVLLLAEAALKSPAAEAQDEAAKSEASDKKSGEGEKDEQASSAGVAAKQAEISLSTEDLRQILGAQLEGQLTGALAATKRFNPLEVTQVQAAIDKLRRAENPEEDGKNEAARADAGPLAVVEKMLGSARETAATGIGADGDAQSQRISSRQEFSRRLIDGANLADVGSSLQADYFLFVTIDEPIFSYRYVRTRLGKNRLIFTAQPTYLYRLFNVRTGTVELAGVARLPEALTEALDLDAREGVVAADESGVLRGRESATRAISSLTFRVNEIVSRLVVQSILNQVSPAKVVRAGSRITINRGANDGIAAGQEFEVYRLGAEIRDEGETGALLEREERYIGVVRVAAVQAASATVESAGGEAPVVGDVLRSAALTATAANLSDRAGEQAASSSSSGMALGEAAILEQRAGGVERPLVAVGEVSVQWVERNQRAEQASKRFADALQRSKRITVLPRADLQRLLRERALNNEAAGDLTSDEAQGLAQSGYIVTGEARVEKSTSQDSVTFEGVTRKTGPVRTVYKAVGSFRAQTIDGKAAAAVEANVTRSGAGSEVEQSAVDALMEAGAEQLLRVLFPIKVIRREGSQVVLAGGADAGLQVGQRVKVFSVGAPVVDPVTGVVLSQGSRTPLGDLVVRTVEEAASTAIFEGAAFAVKAGDVVEPRAGESANPARAGDPKLRPKTPAAEPPPVRF